MSNAEIFVVGAILTVVVLLAITPLIWAAVLDGRAEDAASRERAAALDLDASPGLGT